MGKIVIVSQIHIKLKSGPFSPYVPILLYTFISHITRVPWIYFQLPGLQLADSKILCFCFISFSFSVFGSTGGLNLGPCTCEAHALNSETPPA